MDRTLVERVREIFDQYDTHRVSGLVFIRKKGEPLPVIWRRKVAGRGGMEIKRIECVLIASDDMWCTVELGGERFATEIKYVSVDLQKLNNNPLDV